MPENARIVDCLDEIDLGFVERETTPRLLMKLSVQLHPAVLSLSNTVFIIEIFGVDRPQSGRRRVRPLNGGILHQDVDGRVLFMDRVLDVVPGIPSEGRGDADPLRERRRLLFLLVVEPVMLRVRFAVTRRRPPGRRR